MACKPVFGKSAYSFNWLIDWWQPWHVNGDWLWRSSRSPNSDSAIPCFNKHYNQIKLWIKGSPVCVVSTSHTSKHILQRHAPWLWNTWTHFVDDIIKFIFMNQTFCASIQISLKFVPKGPIYGEQATSHYLNQGWPSSPTHTCSTWGRCVNRSLFLRFKFTIK